MSVQTASFRRQPHRGWAIMENGSIALLVVVVIVLVAGLIIGLWNRKDVAVETTNVQSIVTSTRGYLKGQTGYNFTSGTTMTGTLIQIGGVPKGMTVEGDATSGTATLWNTWGGQVVLAPVASEGGFNNGFSLTYPQVPQDACIAMAQQLSGSFASLAINSTVHSDGVVTAETAGQECTKNSGTSGQNTLIFTVNG